jgi:hypothetical protein
MQRLKTNRAWRTREELKEAIKLEWKAITLKEINQYIIGAEKGRKRDWNWDNRLKECIARNGLMTQF